MGTLEPLLRDHEFFRGLDPHDIALIVGCAANVRFGEGSFLFREGDRADQFFLIRHGKVRLEIVAPPHGPLVVQTLTGGDVAGFSWLFEPHTWQFDARALEPTQAFAINGVCLRAKCEQDPRLGLDLMRRFARIAAQRLHATRLRLIDVYGRADAR